MPKKSTSLLLCFPTSSSTPSLAGAAGVTGQSSRPLRKSLASSVLSGVYFMFLLFANAAMLCTGSIFLSWLEMPREDELRRHLAFKRADFIERYLHNSTSSAKVLDQLLGLVQEAAQKGIVTNFPDGNLHHNSVWSFGSAFLFLTTIATTVGYGHAAPQTAVGKSFSMIYGMIAIPLLLAFFGELIRKLVALLNWVFTHSFGRRFRNEKQGDSTTSDVRIKVVFVLFISVLLIAFTLFVPALTFVHLEPRWTFLDGLYYCFISMTTVGLGDVIPGEGPEWNLDPKTKEFYHIIVAFYLLSALPLFFLAIKLISSLVSTAEMTFRGPMAEEYDSDGEEPTQAKPSIKVQNASDSDDDYDSYDARSGLIGRSPASVDRADSETQMTSDGDEDEPGGPAADDDVVRRGSVNSIKQTTTTVLSSSPAASEINSSFAYLFPQPARNGKSKQQQSAK